MSAIRYPIAGDAQAALSTPLGRAAREREAQGLAKVPVAFITEMTGPAFATREAALDALAGHVDDERAGRGVTVAPEDRFCILREVVGTVPERAPVVAPVEPTFADGRRWPKRDGHRLQTVWRLSVSYWRVPGVAELEDQARRARRTARGRRLDAEALRELARQPLRPVRPQQPLDIGLFETPAPEAPHILIPDE